MPLSWKNKAVPRELESVVHKATAKDPDDRYQAALEFADDLGCVLGKRPVAAKPYRYKFGDKEIAAERPREIIYVSLIFMSISIMLTIYTFYILIDITVFNNFVSSSYALLLTPLDAGLFVISIYLLSGWRWARFAVSLCSILLSIFLLYIFRTTDQLYTSNVLRVILLVGFAPALLAPLLYRRRITTWLKFCEELRQEHKRLKGSTDGD
jgi:hypothetical protein